MRDLLNPKNVVWVTGTNEEINDLRKKAVESLELIKLNQEKLPGCYLHRSKENDVARAEDRTFICTKDKKTAGPTNNWADPKKMKKMLFSIVKNSYKNKTMYVILYCMGPVDSSFSKVGVEITDSIYVVLNMCIITRVKKEVFKKIEALKNDFVKGLHCSCSIDDKKRYICHFPEEKEIISVNSAYGGNALLGKKCFALRIASFMSAKESWLAEHMLILGIENKQGKIHYIACAFPSACGKTNLAMLTCSKIYKEKGYKIWCVGDDIAWMKKGEDGRLWAINPENGFFGVAPGTSKKTNPNASECIRKNTIFTNVVQDLKNNTVWWEGFSKVPPLKALDWKGKPWDSNSKTLGAHPNARFTVSAENCPNLSKEFNSSKGVPISAIIFGGRRADLMPLVFQSRDFNNGVFVGSTIASERTAAATVRSSGEEEFLRRDPMAMLPFCGYNIGKYFKHWINIGKILKNKAPKIFSVNWFRMNENKKFIWPGFSENMRVLEWIFKRLENKVSAAKCEIGYLPYVDDINIEGLKISKEDFKSILKVDKSLWAKEASDIKKFYKKLSVEIPVELQNELKILIKNCSSLM
jgi:phosphoenolpyruvate carboxykinase (GTP)